MLKLDSSFIKIAGLVLLLQVIAVVKQNTSRWLIRWNFDGGIGVRSWYKLSYWLNLTSGQLVTIMVIASFTALTFPIGASISSNVMSKAFPVMRIVQIGSFLAVLPFNFYLMAYRLNEMPVNRGTISGLVIMEVAYVFALFGAWVMYNGAKEVII